MKRIGVETVALFSLYACLGALQVSIAAAQIFFAIAALGWAWLVVSGQSRAEAPAFFRPLVLYAVLTLVASAFSIDPVESLEDSKQLFLLLIVPVAFALLRGPRARTALRVVIAVGALSAIVGIVQYGVLQYDNLGQRPQGALGHYMTYSGVLMLTATAAVARLLFDRHDRVWPAIVLPALLVALVLTFTRSAWVGTCVAVALLFLLKDFRLIGALPVLVAVFFALAPAQVTQRFYSMFDLKDPTSRDRVAMLREGARMIAADPLTGMGPNMVERVYVRFRDTEAVERVNPHLHNVPVQIAAERGLPALGVWLWFVTSAAAGLIGLWRRNRQPLLAATGLGAMVAMAAAGMFEHNFGDSEFLMLLLTLLTLPFAAEQPGVESGPAGTA
ncbi:MAG: O-antigen ligase family protein [Acidobacteriota bacterium]